MGRRTPSPAATRDAITDLPVKSATINCPAQQKGDIEIIVLWEHDLSPIKGVKVDLHGATKGKKTTDGSGRARFKARVPGGYNYSCDLKPVAKRMIARNVEAGAASVLAAKLVTKTVLVREYGKLRVEVRRYHDGGPAELLMGDDVLDLSGGGLSQQNTAQTDAVLLDPGAVMLTVRLDPKWSLIAGENLTATVERGKETIKVLRAAPMTWLEVRVIEAETAKAVSGAKVEAEIHNGGVVETTDAQGGARRAVAGLSDRFKLTAIRPAGGKIYLFESLG